MIGRRKRPIFLVEKANFMGGGEVRLTLRCADRETIQFLEEEGLIGMDMTDLDWMVEVGGNGPLKVVKQKHNCGPNYYRVLVRGQNRSYSEEPRGEPHTSEWSTLGCLKCGYSWRSKSKYVEKIPDATNEEFEEITYLGDFVGHWKVIRE